MHRRTTRRSIPRATRTASSATTCSPTRFALSCLNRLQLRDSRQMVDLQDPAGSLQLVGELENPIAKGAIGSSAA